jgi:hypothetical protein
MKKLTVSKSTSRMSTPLEKNIQRNLALYSIAASAAGVSLIALAPPAEGEVVFTSTHQIIDRRQDLAIDVNHDGITDITIDNLYQKQSGPAGLYAQAVLEAVPETGGAVVADPAAYGAADLSKGASIGPANIFSARRAVMAFKTVQGYFGTYSFGAWFNVSDKFLGFRFKIDGQTHYGWARMTVRWNQRYHIVAALNGYAYETEPGKAIVAGDTGTAGIEAVPGVEAERKAVTLGELAAGRKN